MAFCSVLCVFLISIYALCSGGFRHFATEEITKYCRIYPKLFQTPLQLCVNVTKQQPLTLKYSQRVQWLSGLSGSY